MLELFGFVVLGILLGTLTGLIPGLHPNSVLFMVAALYNSLGWGIINFVGFVVGMAITNTFVDYIPSILLGVPEDTTVLSILPGHRLVIKGRGYEAIKLTVIGGVLAFIMALIMLPVLLLSIPLIYPFLKANMHFILALVLGYFIFCDRNFYVVLIVVLSGIFGVVVLGSHLGNEQILFPVFAGLFGAPVVLTSLRDNVNLPKQKLKIKVPLRRYLKSSALGFVAGVLAGLLPGLGSAQSAWLVQKLGTLKYKGFMVAQGGINTTDIVFSVLALYLIGNPRSGSAIVIQRILEDFTFGHMLLVVGLSIFTVGVAGMLTLKIAKLSVVYVQKIDYRKLLMGVIIFLVIGTGALTGWFGLIVLGTATAIGMIPSYVNVRRSYCMAVLIIPTILYYMGA